MRNFVLKVEGCDTLLKCQAADINDLKQQIGTHAGLRCAGLEIFYSELDEWDEFTTLDGAPDRFKCRIVQAQLRVKALTDGPGVRAEEVRVNDIRSQTKCNCIAVLDGHGVVKIVCLDCKPLRVLGFDKTNFLHSHCSSDVHQHATPLAGLHHALTSVAASGSSVDMGKKRDREEDVGSYVAQTPLDPVSALLAEHPFLSKTDEVITCSICEQNFKPCTKLVSNVRQHINGKTHIDTVKEKANQPKISTFFSRGTAKQPAKAKQNQLAV